MKFQNLKVILLVAVVGMYLCTETEHHKAHHKAHHKKHRQNINDLNRMYRNSNTVKMIHENHLLRNPAAFDNENYQKVFRQDLNQSVKHPDATDPYYLPQQERPLPIGPLGPPPNGQVRPPNVPPQPTKDSLLYQNDKNAYYGEEKNYRVINSIPADARVTPIDMADDVQSMIPSAHNLIKLKLKLASLKLQLKENRSGVEPGRKDALYPTDSQAYYDPTTQYIRQAISVTQKRIQDMQVAMNEDAVLYARLKKDGVDPAPGTVIGEEIYDVSNRIQNPVNARKELSARRDLNNIPQSDYDNFQKSPIYDNLGLRKPGELAPTPNAAPGKGPTEAIEVSSNKYVDKDKKITATADDANAPRVDPVQEKKTQPEPEKKTDDASKMRFKSVRSHSKLKSHSKKSHAHSRANVHAHKKAKKSHRHH